MAVTSRKISAAVGIRNGQTTMANNPSDLATVTDLFDRIPVAKGGTAESGGAWSNDRAALIAEVAAQIVKFQQANAMGTVDGVIDPGGSTLNLMNRLASAPTAGAIHAEVVQAPATEDMANQGCYVVDVNLMRGFRPLKPLLVQTDYVRKLVRVDGCSIKWFGVVIPKYCDGPGAKPHINFTPTPWQGGYSDATYDSFGGWGRLWEDYTSVIGGQLAASVVDQILVIPFYTNGQALAKDLGDFTINWREVVTKVVSVAIDSVNAYRLRKDFTFDRIVSSSFSNGWIIHQEFNTNAAGAATMTDFVFDLDGVAGGSNWRPKNGVIYQNRKAPGTNSPNPVANVWYVGERWGSEFVRIYNGQLNTHAACRNHLLYHGLFEFCLA